MNEKQQNRRHWLRFIVKLSYLYFRQPQKTKDLVNCSYNKISRTYDATWTNHMQQFSEEMVKKLIIPVDALCLDLMCGTGYVTGKLAEHNIKHVVGVDASEGMLQVARTKVREKSIFVQSDILQYLTSQPSKSFDVITCVWGLGYSHPSRVIHEISRVLKPGGYVGIIDNSIFSISEMYFTAIPVLAEKPDAITHVMKIHFLTGARSLSLRMKLSGIKVIESWFGTKEYYAYTGKEAVERMKATGAAAGFEFSFQKGLYEERQQRYVELLEQRYGNKIPIIHRYIAAIGIKKK